MLNSTSLENPLKENVSQCLDLYQKTRRETLQMCAPLEIEDYCVQPIEDVSPPKWHLGHTTWFFETNILKTFEPHFEPYHPQFHFLFNSYYESLGPRTPRPKRGTLSRPTVREIIAYRHLVDQRILNLPLSSERLPEFLKLIEIGIHHEQQHQELLWMDIKFIYFQNAIPISYGANAERTTHISEGNHFSTFSEGKRRVGYDGMGFSYDNERPSHERWVPGFAIAQDLVSNGDYLEFIEAGGYREPTLWLADGWDWVQRENCSGPQYWKTENGQRLEFSLSGWKKLDPSEPVCHVSFFEADAFARWKGARLPTEEEWETACAMSQNGELKNLFGSVWQWTLSSYLPYPGFRPEDGALQEYNGKFMNNQRVCRGSSIFTPKGHARSTYRNFFQPEKRWQRTGIRLAKP